MLNNKNIYYFIVFLLALFVASANCQWQKTNGGNDQSRIRGIKTAGSHVFECNENETYYSDDFGVNWQVFHDGMKTHGVSSFEAIGSTVFALSSAIYPLLYRSVDGKIWEDVTPPTGTPWPTAMCMSGGALLVAESAYAANIESVINRSIDSVKNWAQVWDGGQASNIDALISLDSSFILVKRGDTHQSSDGGINWELDTDSITPKIKVFTSNGKFDFAASDSSLYRSSDKGKTWTVVNSGLSFGFSCFAFSGEMVFGGSASGVFVTTNDGTKWQSINTGIADSQVTALAVSGVNVIAGTAHEGVFYRPLSDFGISSVPQKTILENPLSSFPNPFSQSTTLTFTSDNRIYTEISILNLLGAEVAQLYSGGLEAGEHSFLWVGSTMPQGIYFCKLRTEGKVKMVPVILKR